MNRNGKKNAALKRKAELEAELKRVLPLIIRDYRPERVILFGSLATGDVHEWSDIDLVIVKKTELSYFDRLFEFKKMIRAKHATDVFIYTPKEFGKRFAENHYFLIDEILGKGKVLYERNGRMVEVCEG